MESYVSEDKYADIITLASLIFYCLSDQGNGNDAKETTVNSLSLKGVKDSKDGGVKESFVSPLVDLPCHSNSIIFLT